MVKTQLLCPVTVLVDSQVSDRCPWATCYNCDDEMEYKSMCFYTANVREHCHVSFVFNRELSASMGYEKACLMIIILITAEKYPLYC